MGMIVDKKLFVVYVESERLSFKGKFVIRGIYDNQADAVEEMNSFLKKGLVSFIKTREGPDVKDFSAPIY